jgi:hypothetical protein
MDRMAIVAAHVIARMPSSFPKGQMAIARMAAHTCLSLFF